MMLWMPPLEGSEDDVSSWKVTRLLRYRSCQSAKVLPLKLHPKLKTFLQMGSTACIAFATHYVCRS
jgi:hypothetical protein